MDLPLDDNRGRLSYWLFYAQRCVAYAYAEVLRAHCEERAKPYVITPPQWGALSLLRAPRWTKFSTPLNREAMLKGKKQHESRHRPRLRESILRRYVGWHRVRDPLRFAWALRDSGRTCAAPASSSAGNEVACAGARLVCANGGVRDCLNGSQWRHIRFLVSVCGGARRVHLDLDPGRRHRRDQQCHG